MNSNQKSTENTESFQNSANKEEFTNSMNAVVNSYGFLRRLFFYSHYNSIVSLRNKINANSNNEINMVAELFFELNRPLYILGIFGVGRDLAIFQKACHAESSLYKLTSNIINSSKAYNTVQAIAYLLREMFTCWSNEEQYNSNANSDGLTQNLEVNTRLSSSYSSSDSHTLVILEDDSDNKQGVVNTDGNKSTLSKYSDIKVTKSPTYNNSTAVIISEVTQGSQSNKTQLKQKLVENHSTIEQKEYKFDPTINMDETFNPAYLAQVLKAENKNKVIFTMTNVLKDTAEKLKVVVIPNVSPKVVENQSISDEIRVLCNIFARYKVKSDLNLNFKMVCDAIERASPVIDIVNTNFDQLHLEIPKYKISKIVNILKNRKYIRYVCSVLSKNNIHTKDENFVREFKDTYEKYLGNFSWSKDLKWRDDAFTEDLLVDFSLFDKIANKFKSLPDLITKISKEAHELCEIDSGIDKIKDIEKIKNFAKIFCDKLKENDFNIDYILVAEEKYKNNVKPEAEKISSLSDVFSRKKENGNVSLFNKDNHLNKDILVKLKGYYKSSCSDKNQSDRTDKKVDLEDSLREHSKEVNKTNATGKVVNLNKNLGNLLASKIKPVTKSNSIQFTVRSHDEQLFNFIKTFLEKYSDLTIEKTDSDSYPRNIKVNLKVNSSISLEEVVKDLAECLKKTHPKKHKKYTLNSYLLCVDKYAPAFNKIMREVSEDFFQIKINTGENAQVFEEALAANNIMYAKERSDNEIKYYLGFSNWSDELIALLSEKNISADDLVFFDSSGKTQGSSDKLKVLKKPKGVEPIIIQLAIPGGLRGRFNKLLNDSDIPYSLSEDGNLLKIKNNEANLEKLKELFKQLDTDFYREFFLLKNLSLLDLSEMPSRKNLIRIDLSEVDISKLQKIDIQFDKEKDCYESKSSLYYYIDLDKYKDESSRKELTIFLLKNRIEPEYFDKEKQDYVAIYSLNSSLDKVKTLQKNNNGEHNHYENVIDNLSNKKL